MRWMGKVHEMREDDKVVDGRERGRDGDGRCTKDKGKQKKG